MTKYSILDFGSFGNSKKTTCAVGTGAFPPFTPLQITRRKHDPRASVLSRAVEPLRAKRPPPRFLHLDRCRWAKDAGRRSERTCPFAECTTLHSNDDLSLGVSFSDKKTPRPNG